MCFIGFRLELSLDNTSYSAVKHDLNANSFISPSDRLSM